MANMVDNKLTLSSGWQSVDTGSTLIYDVEDPSGNPTATAVVFFGIDDNQVWYDLASSLTVGQPYKITAEVKVGHRGFTGPLEMGYFDSDTALKSTDITLSGSGWEVVEFTFTPDATATAPSIRLIGWDAGANQEYLLINDVQVVETALDGVVSDPKTHPRGEPTSFSKPTMENRGAILAAYPEPTTMEDFTTVIQRDFNSYMEWGEEDTVIRSADDAPFEERYFRTTMLAGTSSGSDVEGGTGWEGAFISADRAALRYKVRFQPNFDWVKGGKLPGLYGGDSPSGGATADNGFTARMMWRTDGQGELYTYNLNREDTYGDSIGRGMFNFTPGVWHTIEQEVILNTVDDATGDVYGDGMVRIWFDGNPIFEVNGMVFRTSNSIKVEGIMSTIFFGGSDQSWRTPVDQYIETGDFKIYTPA